MSETTQPTIDIEAVRERLAALEEAQRKEGEAIVQAETQIAQAKANRQARAGRIAELRRIIDPPKESTDGR